MRVFLGALFALAVMSSPALAQNLKADVSLAKDSRLVKSINVEDLKAIVVASGYEVTEVGGMGDVSVQAKTDEGLIFLLIGTACEVEGYKPNCLGINMQIRYDGDEDVTVAKVNQATLTYAAVSTWWDEDSNTLGITRYTILDDGVTMANIKANLTTLLAIAPRITGIIWP
ncbi:MAG: YbjN domain-containing protein [Caulobacter sp.]|nr:YbjN domain-containing protein [Caulobacter sp.]